MFSVFTAGSIFRPISRVMGVINEFGFDSLHHLQMRLQPDKNQKNRQKKFYVFTAGSIFWPISRVMGVIKEIGFRRFLSFKVRLQPDKNQKNRREKVFRFYCRQHILAHISGHGCDK